MRLYHGSDVEVRSIDLSRSLMYKDFGPGFYVSADLKQAAGCDLQTAVRFFYNSELYGELESLMAAGASADVLFEKLEREFAGVTSEVDMK